MQEIPQQPAAAAAASATPFPAATITPVSASEEQGTEQAVETFDACAESSGRLEKVYYQSAVLHETLEVRVYLPPCYDEGNEQYPAAYFFHGSPPSSADWVTLGVVEAMDAGVSLGVLPPAVLVFPLQPDAIFIWSDGGPASYEEEFFLGLVPFIEESYRVVSRGDARAMAGISRGGVWALEISMMHPDDFDSVAALSPALQYNDPRPQYDPFQLVQLMARSPRHLLLMAGDQDWALNETQALGQALEQAGKAFVLEVGTGSHEASLWSGSMDEVLAFLLQEW